MLKRLRRKFILINMTFVLVMLGILIAIVLHTTVAELEQKSLMMLQMAEAEMEMPTPPDVPAKTRLVYFAVFRTESGDFVAEGSELFDLTDESFLSELMDATENSGEKTGILWNYELRYLRSDSPRGEKVLFADISVELGAIKSLVSTCLLIALLAPIAFWLLSLFLARWAVKPVEQAWDRQKQFVADASHELKTPLTVITTNAELLEQGCSEAQAAQCTENILVMSRQMRGLTEGLLDLARLDNGTAKKAFSPLSLSELVEDAVLCFEAVFFERELFLKAEIESGLCVKGNEKNLRQVVDILLDNAQKYAQTGTEVLLGLRRSGGQCLLSVQTQSQPLTKEQCSRIFERFYRCDEARSLNGSYGLGLPIAQGIVQAHGGKIWAQSQPEGNIFTVQLPLVSTSSAM